MPIKLNHTIVNVRDKRKSANFFSEFFGLPKPVPTSELMEAIATIRINPTGDLPEPLPIAQAAAALSKLYGLLDTPVDVAEPSSPAELPPTGDIRVEGVSFAYASGRPVLQDVNSTRAGSSTPIVAGRQSLRPELGRAVKRMTRTAGIRASRPSSSVRMSVGRASCST